MKEKNPAVLVVDDEQEMRNMLKKMLSRNGYQVLEAPEGKSALSVLSSNPDIEVVLLDLVMPEMDGSEAFRIIKQRFPDIQIVFLSGQGSIHEVVSLIKEGAFDYIEKPFDTDLLLARIEQAIRFKDLNSRFHFLDERYSDVKKLKRYNEDILRHMPIGLLVIDKKDRIRMVNKQAQNILRVNDLENKTVNEFVPLRFTDQERFYRLYENTKKSKAESNELFLDNPDPEGRSQVHYRVVLSSFSHGILFFIQDITKGYNVKQRADHEERMAAIGQFAAGITHGLGNNMANIISNASGVEDELENINRLCSDISVPQEIKKIKSRMSGYAERLIKRTYEMDRNVKSLLNFSRSRRPILFRQPSDCNILLEDAITVVSAGTGKGLEFKSQKRSVLPKISLNPGQMREAFIDLLMNAVQAMNGKGRVLYSTEFLKKENAVQISIVDQGPGIPDEIRENIFSAFYTTKPSGTGLGLYNVKNAVKEHQGEIGFLCAKTGGTIFQVRLPVQSE